MAAARPIVGTQVGVERIGFNDRDHGLLRDTPAGLAAGLVELLADSSRGVIAGTAAREAVRSYEWSALAAPLQERYRAAVEGAR